MESASRAQIVIGLVFVVTVAALFRLVNLDHEPTSDELYHLLAAESWVESGTFAVGDGHYPRASSFTRLIGLVHGVTDGSLLWIRSLCVFVGILLIVSVYFSVNRLIGIREALVASTMLALMPVAIYLAQFIRFYSLHALTFWCAAIALYYAVVELREARHRLLFAAFALGLFAFSAHLQKTTFIGLAGIGVWLTFLAVPPLWKKYCGLSRRERRIAAGITSAIIAFSAVILLNPVSQIVDDLLSASLWSTKTHAGYYAIRYRDQFGLFWSLFPVAAILSLAVRPKPTFYCLCIFGVAFVFHSLAGMRSERYLFYGMPFFVTIWSIALVHAFSRFNIFLTGQLDRLVAPQATTKLSKNLANMVSAVFVGWIILMTPATEMTTRMVIDKPSSLPRYWFGFSTSWNSAQDTIRTLVEESEIFLTSQGHHAFYFIGDFDIEVSATGLSDFQEHSGGSDIDPRTGRRVIADVTAMREIRTCNQSGVLVIHVKAWRRFAGVSDTLADYIEQNMDRVETPSEWGMQIFSWSGETPEPAVERNIGAARDQPCER